MIQRRGVALGLAAGLATAACVPPPPAPERAAYITGEGGPPPGTGPRAGLLLPLSGADAPIGQALLDAARQALAEIEPGPLVLVPQDTVPEAGLAARRAVELGCGLLIGPLGAGAARQAAGAGRPVLALSNDTGIARPGLWPFGISPESQAARVAALAAARGRTRLAAVLPEDAYGTRLLRGLQAVRPETIELVAVLGHPAAGLPPADLADRLGGADAVFVGAGGPVPGAAAAGLAPAPFAPQLLGTLEWLRAPDPAGAPPPPGAWLALPDPAAGASFADRHAFLFRRPVSPWALLVADAVGVAAAVGREDGFPLPVLTRPEGFTGRLGGFRLLADGRVERLLAVAETRAGGGLEVVDPAPASFGAVAG